MNEFFEKSMKGLSSAVPAQILKNLIRFSWRYSWRNLWKKPFRISPQMPGDDSFKILVCFRDFSQNSFTYPSCESSRRFLPGFFLRFLSEDVRISLGIYLKELLEHFQHDLSKKSQQIFQVDSIRHFFDSQKHSWFPVRIPEQITSGFPTETTGNILRKN